MRDVFFFNISPNTLLQLSSSEFSVKTHAHVFHDERIQSFVFNVFWTLEVQRCKCCVYHQCITQWCCTSISNLVVWKMKHSKHKNKHLLFISIINTHNLDSDWWVFCWFLMLHLKPSFQCLQSCLLLNEDTLKSFCFSIHIFTFSHPTNWVQEVLCLFSALHLKQWHQHLQSHLLFKGEKHYQSKSMIIIIEFFVLTTNIEFEKHSVCG